MSLREEFKQLMKTKPIPPYATLPSSGIDVEWSELMDGWKIDMGMDINEFFRRNPDIFQAVQERLPDLDLKNISTRDILKRGVAEEILNQLIIETDIPGEADRIFKGQRLRNVATGTLTAEARNKIYERAFERGQLPDRTSLNPEGGVRQRSIETSPIQTRPPRGGLHLGEVPHDIVDKEFQRYINSLRSKTGKRVEDNSFEYEGKRYGFEKASLKDRKSRSLEADNKGWKLYRSGDKVENFEMRRFSKERLTPYMSEAEWLRMRDIYRVAADRGLEVDHIQPLEAKGLHHPDNLQLLTRDDNRLKNSIWDPEGDNFRSRAIPWEQPIGPRTKRDVTWAKNKRKWSWDNALDHTTLKHIDGFSRYGSKADALANLGFSAVSGDVAGTLMAAPGVALTTRVGQKGLYKALAKFGSQRAKSFIPGLSIAGNTADVVRYTAGGRPLQATLAGAAGVLDEMQNPISEGLATAIQFGNTVTDYLRGDYKQTTGDDVDVNRNTLRHIDVDGSYNRLLRNF